MTGGVLQDLLPIRDPGLLSHLERLLAELLKWNQTHNLTGHQHERSVVVDLFLDALAMVEQVRGETLLDIGSGAGFPGLVLALAMPDLRVTLLEPRAKRVSFQKQAVRLLGLGDRVRPVMGRAGDAELAGQVFDTVTVRAVGSLDESLALARPYAAPGGRVILPRGVKDRAEAQGMGLRVVEYELPEPGGRRILAIWDWSD